MKKENYLSGKLAAAITKSASRQTYYTIRLLADRDRVIDAYRAYGYFRWVDDVVDSVSGSVAERIAFVNRQKSILDKCYSGHVPEDLCTEECMLFDLIRRDTESSSGLKTYLQNMMDVMVFDAMRRGRLVSSAELSDYSQKLSVAVTEAIYYFIGHHDPSPRHEARYLAVYAAHIVHMLRDALEDSESGYFNIPREFLAARGISARDITSEAYREWVCGRIQLARGYFKAGRECTAQARNWRCRLAGFAYTARFEWMLNAIERDHYCLRSEYPERKSLRTGLWMTWSALIAMFAPSVLKPVLHKFAVQSVQMDKR